MYITNSRGFSFVELLVTTAIIALVFGGLMASFQYAISLVGLSKERSGALALANERVEYIRSLAYDAVGTEGGIPSGSIPQTRTVTLNDITYTEDVLVAYVDDPDDGTGAADETGILADYKQVKVTYSWEHKTTAKSISLITNIVPKGIESTAGGGTLTVNVFDASVQPVVGASVRVYNNNGTTTIDTTRNTNDSGVAQFAGADALSGYEITVTKDGYSIDGTYTASSTNQNPSPAPVSVIKGEVSTMSFQIDETSNLTINTVGEPTSNTISDTFSDTSAITAMSSTTVSGGAVVLTNVAGVYDAGGAVRADAVTPAIFDRWDSATCVGDTPTGTTLIMHLYDVSGGSAVLVSDSDLVGNSTGFACGSAIDLSGLSAAMYPTLALGAVLGTSDTATTSVLTDWGITYVIDEPPIGNIAFTMTGTKTIGTTASSAPVYKYEQTLATDATGELALTDLEYDTYDIALSGSAYNIAEACSALPYTLDPGVSDTLKLTLATAVSNSLRVAVRDPSGNAITGAAVTLSRTGFIDNDTTSMCGQVFFNSGVGVHDDYEVTVSASGYTTETVSSVSVLGYTTLILTLVTS